MQLFFCEFCDFKESRESKMQANKTIVKNILKNSMLHDNKIHKKCKNGNLRKCDVRENIVSFNTFLGKRFGRNKIIKVGKNLKV